MILSIEKSRSEISDLFFPTGGFKIPDFRILNPIVSQRTKYFDQFHAFVFWYDFSFLRPNMKHKPLYVFKISSVVLAHVVMLFSDFQRSGSGTRFAVKNQRIHSGE